jgi:peroxiredoxin
MQSPFQAAPDFVLPDHRGGQFHLHGSSRTGPIVIVFYRGHWCPYCRRYLAKLQANHGRLVQQGVALVAISPEPQQTSCGLAVELGIEFPLLSDTSGEVIDRYNTRSGFSAGRILLPHASLFIVGGDGALRYKSIDRNYKRRTTMHTIFSVIGGMTGMDKA